MRQRRHQLQRSHQCQPGTDASAFVLVNLGLAKKTTHARPRRRWRGSGGRRGGAGYIPPLPPSLSSSALASSLPPTRLRCYMFPFSPRRSRSLSPVGARKGAEQSKGAEARHWARADFDPAELFRASPCCLDSAFSTVIRAAQSPAGLQSPQFVALMRELRQRFFKALSAPTPFVCEVLLLARRPTQSYACRAL